MRNAKKIITLIILSLMLAVCAASMFEKDLLNNSNGSDKVILLESASLVTAKQVAIQELEDEYNEYDNSDYSSSNWTVLTKIFNDAKTEIIAAANETEIAEIKAQAISDMAEVITLAEEFENYKKAAIDELIDELDKYDRSDYSTTGWSNLETILNNAKSAINTALSSIHVDTAKTKCINDFKDVLTLAGEFDVEKQEALVELYTEFAKYNLEDYSAVNWITITTLYGQARQEIKDATTSLEVTNIKNTAISEMEAVERLDEVKPDHTGLIVILSILGLIIVSYCVLFVLYIKKIVKGKVFDILYFWLKYINKESKSKE